MTRDAQRSVRTEYATVVPASSAAAHELVQRDAMDFFDLPKGLVVADQRRGTFVHRACDVNRVGGAQIVFCSDRRCAIGNLERQRHPSQARTRGEETEELAGDREVIQSVRLDENFEQRERRRHTFEPTLFQSAKKVRAEGSVRWMALNQVDENVGIDADSLVLAHEARNTLHHFQARRSFSR